jgi:uncharacterized protein YutE (UPF0331/DUF86 family)
MSADKENLFDEIAQFREEFSAKMLLALKDGLAAVNEVVAAKKHIGKYYDFPKLTYRENGLPNLSSSPLGGPTEYINSFRSWGRERLINEDELESFGQLVTFVREHSKLHERFITDNWGDHEKSRDIELDAIIVKTKIEESIERYIHTNNSFEYNESQAISAIKPILSHVFDEELAIDIVVPLLFVDCEVENYEISERVYVQRLTDEYHLSRYNLGSYSVSAHKSVISSATHALIFEGWIVSNQKRIIDSSVLSTIEAYPLDLIGKFFGALRISTDIATGYGQVFSVARGWSADCKANLPYVLGTTVRSYPSWFENFYWNTEHVPKLSREEIENIGRIYEKLINAKENSIGLAIKRLNRCLVRDSEEDSVLDATIALEALLSDEGNQEMTHKLAMRVGAISKLSNGFEKSPQQAFDDIKRIYSYRSAIVHGSSSLDKKRTIKIAENKNVLTHSLAVEYLRMLLKVLLDNPCYRDPKRIDSDLLLGD